MKSNKLYILIALLLTVVAGVSYYLYQIKKENDWVRNNVLNLDKGECFERDDTNEIFKKFNSEIERDKKYCDQRPEPKPVTNFAEIESLGIIEIDPKLYTNNGAVLNTKELKIDYDLKEVTFCGEVYKAKQIIIDGVDITQRLSEILLEDKDLNDWFCEMSISSAKNTGGIINPNEEVRIVLYTTEKSDTYEYSISFGIGLTDLSKNKFPPYSFGSGFMFYISIEKNIFSIGYKPNKLHTNK